ncbi:BICC [Mytilus edulis]|uniref:BICC1 n=1 Tax=Mytilus edulis TaxID=6550 RepID=A0A8S3UT93_MYTED|nr:BICC [Mytilus edulis]
MAESAEPNPSKLKRLKKTNFTVGEEDLIQQLVEKHSSIINGKLTNTVTNQLKKRIPFLFDVLCCVAIPASGKISDGIIPVLASCYSILMKHRFHNLSAFHRLTTIIATKGGLDDRAQTRLNHLGLYLSSERRLRLQDSAQEKNLKLLTENLKTQPLVKITEHGTTWALLRMSCIKLKAKKKSAWRMSFKFWKEYGKHKRISSLDTCKLLSDDDLKELGISTIGERTAFRDAVNNFIDETPPAEPMDIASRRSMG